ncbi:hypothetical protein WJX73_000786 [Symbiochloris irregularis]|uniref:Uncharacterized protein n=1 Tax=Symbiochloris irregularis TaxID=706552 RepID=A0AAW1P215_9CHLO
MAAVCSIRSPVALRPAKAQRSPSVAVRASAAPQREQNTQKPAQWAAAGFAALLLVASPAAMAGEKASGLKPKICANNPTAKICLRDSFASAKSQQQAGQN